MRVRRDIDDSKSFLSALERRHQRCHQREMPDVVHAQLTLQTVGGLGAGWDGLKGGEEGGLLRGRAAHANPGLLRWRALPAATGQANRSLLPKNSQNNVISPALCQQHILGHRQENETKEKQQRMER